MASLKEYKSSVFSLLMEDPRNCLEVYNALNDSNYDNPDEVEINRLENGIALSIRNDSSFIIDMYLNIFEQQSTYNPNMPLRSLIYFIDIIKPIVMKRDLYSRKKIIIPTPRFVVFYNGTEKRPEKEELYLSDSFEHEQDCPELELKCTVYNINNGANKEFMSKCKTLREYMEFVDRIRYNVSNNMELKEAIDNAISTCVDEGILEEFLINRGNEVRQVAALDYTFERREQLFRAEEREEGRKEGRVEGIEIGKSEGIEIGKSEGIEIGKSEGIEIGKSEGIEIGKSEGIRVFIIDKLEDNVSKDKIVEKLVKLYKMSETEANDFYKEALSNYNE